MKLSRLIWPALVLVVCVLVLTGCSGKTKAEAKRYVELDKSFEITGTVSTAPLKVLVNDRKSLQILQALWPEMTGNMSLTTVKNYRVNGKLVALFGQITEGGRKPPLKPNMDLMVMYDEIGGDNNLLAGGDLSVITGLYTVPSGKGRVSVWVVPKGWESDPKKFHLSYLATN